MSTYSTLETLEQLIHAGTEVADGQPAHDAARDLGRIVDGSDDPDLLPALAVCLGLAIRVATMAHEGKSLDEARAVVQEQLLSAAAIYLDNLEP